MPACLPACLFLPLPLPSSPLPLISSPFSSLSTSLSPASLLLLFLSCYFYFSSPHLLLPHRLPVFRLPLPLLPRTTKHSVVRNAAASFPVGAKTGARPGGTPGAPAGQPAAEGESVFSKILPGGAAEQAGKLTEGITAWGQVHTGWMPLW